MRRISRYFRLSLTSECNLSCYFCHNEGQERLFAFRDLLSKDDIVWLCQAARESGFRKFKLTGGEPTIRKDLFEIITGIRASGIDDLSMITNGTRLKTMARELRQAGLPRLNVSLFTLDPLRFREENGGSAETLERIVSGIDEAISVGFSDIKLNYVWHHRNRVEDFLDVAQFAAQRHLTVVVLPLMDEFGARAHDEYTTLGMVHRALREIGVREERFVLDHEGIRRRLIHLSTGATVLLRAEELGEVAPYAECASCIKRPECREGIFPLRLGADGVLKPCLAEGRAPVNLLAFIKSRDTTAVRRAFQAVLFGAGIERSEEELVHA